MSGKKAFEQFCAKHGDDAGADVMERISDAIWTQKGDERLRLDNLHALNACNHVAEGDIEHDGSWFSFVVEAGDWNGAVIHGWGDLHDVSPYIPPRPTIYDLMPANRALEIEWPGMFGVYLAWRETEWFRKMAQSYNYDRHFAPGGKTENHYRAKAAERGLVFAIDDDVKARIDAFKAQEGERS